MPVPQQYREDVLEIVEKRHHNGGDFWATADGRWGKGSPFSTFDCALMLSDLGLERSEPILEGAAAEILRGWKEGGRISPAPQTTTYPCHTANAARALCRLGYARDPRLVRTFEHLLDKQHKDGGWRCNVVKLGRSPETDASNPGVTLAALDAFRFSRFLNRDVRLDPAARFLLDHWETRRPLGPCKFGIGSLFMQAEYPLRRYNLFSYVYVLSFYDAAKGHANFKRALRRLESKLVDGQVVVENPNRRLARFSFCKKGQPSQAATRHYREIMDNIAQ